MGRIVRSWDDRDNDLRANKDTRFREYKSPESKDEQEDDASPDSETDED